jgi:hypothetical protein
MCPTWDGDVSTREDDRRKERALSRAALVLLCSHMEGFFEDLVQDVLSFHERDGTSIKMLPVALRVKQSLTHVATLTESGTDDMRRWTVIQRFRSEPLFDETQACQRGLLDAALHTRGFASPGSEELARLFASVGFGRLWEEVHARPHGALLKNSLDALVHRRHHVAHGDLSATITPGDLSSFVVDMQALADRVDVVVGEWLEDTHLRRNPWGVLL